MASTVSRVSSSPSWRNRAWTAGISLDFSSQSRCASTKVEADANALRIVLEGVEALPQCLAVHGDVPLARRSRLLVKDGGMAAERLLDRSRVELPEKIVV